MKYKFSAFSRRICYTISPHRRVSRVGSQNAALAKRNSTVPSLN
jgi:hypothetical protein